MQERIDLQQMFDTITGLAIDITNDANKRSKQISRSITTNSSSTSMSDSVDLLKIQLPIFSGAYEDWPGFADQFRSTVHDNPRIEVCKRSMYLRYCVTHKATFAIASLSNAAVNYLAAWDILEERYNKPAKIVEKHLKEMIDTAPLSRNHIETYSPIQQR